MYILINLTSTGVICQLLLLPIKSLYLLSKLYISIMEIIISIYNLFCMLGVEQKKIQKLTKEKETLNKGLST